MRLYQVTLIGPPSVGKTSIIDHVHDRAGYAVVGVDEVFQSYLSAGMAPGSAKVCMFVNFRGHRMVPLHQGQSTMVDGAGLDGESADLLVGLHPCLRARLVEQGNELQRYIVELSAAREVLVERDRARGRSAVDIERMERTRDNWVPVPEPYQDTDGEVPVLRFPNNTPEDRDAIYRTLSERLNVPLL